MPKMVGLPGVKADRDAPVFFKGSDKAIRIVREGGTAVAAGPRGSITFYRDDTGQVRGIRDRHRQTEDERLFMTAKTARGWLIAALKLIR